MSKLKAKLKDILKNSGVKQAVTAQVVPFQKGDMQQAKQPTETCQVADKVVRLCHMRPACQKAGHCLALTVERDCNLYPAGPGWCRERIRRK